MSTNNIENLFVASDHAYLPFQSLDDSLMPNNQDFDNEIDDPHTMDAITGRVNSMDTAAVISDDSSDELIDVIENGSLTDHNYSNNITDTTNVKLTMLIQTNSREKCEYCDKVFANITSLRRHMRCHTKEQPFKCQVCEKSFSQQSNLWKHVRVHTGERPFECPQCRRKFSQRANMKKHLLTHSGEKPYDCAYCNKTFSQLANRNKHVQLHFGSRPYKCEYCEKSFSQRSNMQKHQYLHENIRPFTCDICNTSFTQESNLKKHIAALHTDVKPYVCEDCGNAYVQKINFTKHKRTCTGDVQKSINSFLECETEAFYKIILPDGTESNYYIDKSNQFIKLGHPNNLESEEGISNESIFLSSGSLDEN